MGLNSNLLTEQEVFSIIKDVLSKKNLLNGKIEISSGSNKGDGFLSFMNKVKVTDKNKKLELILKCAPKSKEFRKMVPLNMLFKREVRFYDQIYPKLMEFQEQMKIKEPFRNIPKCYKTISEEFGETIILANIKDGEGFEVFDKRLQMDDGHVVKVFELYGKFHAISFAMKEHYKKLYDELTDNLYDVIHNFPAEFFIQFDTHIESTKLLFPGEDEKYIVEALTKLKPEVREVFEDLGTNRATNDVINHGDCWCNNMMFKYQDGTKNILDIKLIDFQICRASSPVLDLAYFMYVSASKDIYNNLDHYLNIYYESLTNSLKEYGCDAEKIYPFSSLKADWNKYSRFGYIMALMLIKTVLMEGNEVFDFNDIIEGRANMEENYVFKNEGIANQRMKDITLFVVNNGYI